MNKAISILLLLSCIAMSCHPIEELELCDKDEIRSSKLISIEDANKQLSNPNTVFVQVSNSETFQKGHLPGAISIWRPDFRSQKKEKYSGLKCSKNELENLLSKMGVNSATDLLIYDTKCSCDALRFAWVLDYYGFKNYKVINGGLAAWVESGLEIEKGGSQAKDTTSYKLELEEDSSLIANYFDVLAAIDDPNTIILDTREPYEYLGQPFMLDNSIQKYKKGASDAGCIPTAININWSDFCDLSNDHRIKCRKDILHTLEVYGVDSDKSIIVYCQSGSRSSHTAFILKEIVGMEKVKNYDGSWIEWSYLYSKDRSVPIEQKTSQEDLDRITDILNKEIKEKNG